MSLIGHEMLGHTAHNEASTRGWAGQRDPFDEEQPRDMRAEKQKQQANKRI